MLALVALAFVTGAAAQTPECTDGSEAACANYRYTHDFDGDGIDDDVDNCPFAFNPDQLDGDGEGRGDGCDNCPTIANADLADTDADGIGDLCDDDGDNDGIPNSADNCLFVANPGQENADSTIDGLGDLCDDNDDGDACLDPVDNCPLLDTGGNCSDVGVIAPSACFRDSDADGIDDALDNCPALPNLDQRDSDGDGVGDACDHDLDNDDIDNTFDNCISLPNAAQTDIDHDGLGDPCDPFVCFVVTDEQSCLDPAAPFAVHAGPPLDVEVGAAPALLHIFANRDSRAIDYAWSVVDEPVAGAAVLAFAAGTVSTSQLIEYVYNVDSEATFTPRAPGEYTLHLAATLEHPEVDAFPEVATAEADLAIHVTGEALGEGEGEGDGEGEGEGGGEGEGEGEGEGDDNGGGCACGNIGNTGGDAVGIGFAALGGLAAFVLPPSCRRRRR